MAKAPTPEAQVFESKQCPNDPCLPRNIHCMIHPTHCFPVFKVPFYVAIEVFGFSPEELAALQASVNDSNIG